MKRTNVVFLSSSFVNIAKLFAINNKNFDVFLILDRKFPQYFEDEELDNFYVFTFDKNKQFEKSREKYFDNLSIFLEQFEAKIIICNNYNKLLPKSFIDFQKFRNKNIKINNIHHADLSIIDKNNKPYYIGMNQEVKQMLEDEKLITTIHNIENEKMDEGKHIAYSFETSLKELKQKHLIHKKEEILNLRLRNVVISYHERTKVLNLLGKIMNGYI